VFFFPWDFVGRLVRLKKNMNQTHGIAQAMRFANPRKSALENQQIARVPYDQPVT
jgi:hypothetical protein